MPWFFGWEADGLVFDVAVHVGTAVAVLTFFWADWIILVREFFAGLIERKPFGNHHRRLAWLLVLGTVPAVIIGLAFEDVIEEQLRSPLITVFTLSGLAVLLLFAERTGKQNRTIEKFGWIDSLVIGCSQAVALIPGVSRSGITMTTALFRDSTRTGAARFSFLLSTPVIVGAGVLQGWRLFNAVQQPGAAVDVNWSVLGVGAVFAAVTGFLCIQFFLRYLQTKSFLPFVIYRFVLAAVVLAYYIQM